MNLKPSIPFQAFLFCMLIPSVGWTGAYPGRPLLLEKVHSIQIRYESAKKFPSLQEKLGSTIGLAPVKDTRHGRLYVGHYRFGRISNYLRSEPFPLENAIRDSLLKLLSLQGINTVPIPDWDGREESLMGMGVDSLLMIDIKRFWAEGMIAGRGTSVSTSIYLVIRLGVKKEGRVFRRDMYTIKKDSTVGLTPSVAEDVINETLDEILDDFFSDPY